MNESEQAPRQMSSGAALIPCELRAPDHGASTNASRPSRARLALVMILLVYPVVTSLLYLVGPLTPDWQIWHRTLLVTPLTVISIVFGVSPLVARYLAWYVSPR